MFEKNLLTETNYIHKKYTFVEASKTLRVLLGLLLLATCPIAAQSWNFKHLIIDDGLSQNSVIDIAQDSLVFLWFATLDGTNITIHEKYFIDLTGNQSFRLGQLYCSRTNKLWLTNIDGDLTYYGNNRQEIATIPEIQEASCVFICGYI